MKLQSITKNFLSSAFLLSPVYTSYVASPTTLPSSTKNVAANVAFHSGDESAMYQIMLDNSSPAISKRDYYKKPLLSNIGAICDKKFYSKYLIKTVAMEACNKLQKIKKKKITSCAPPILPFYQYNFPCLYNGPPELFKSADPLYVWPIVTSRFRKTIGTETLHSLLECTR
ncbi:hypothetical protein OnM2_004036 [Erysiphe neolycopersici]|uniref:Uncharacterized protein n=1 Tax=Erysiphe neolycopersici TaxID=212602 RepID=A0A420I7R6_9PEZI|nr:hypothetical protein OnM2_004036 [Erysiphe neolycopersici]